MWIGGVAFVTTVVIPEIRATRRRDERLSTFQHFEKRFIWQARFWVLLAGVTGFWMVARADMWHRYLAIEFWWMHAMLVIWLVFFVTLFVIEPLTLQAGKRRRTDPGADFARLEILHCILLFLLLLTVLGAALGSRGFP